MHGRLARTVALLTSLLLAASGARVRAAEWYYVMVFGSQSSPKALRYTHTWATFVKAEGEGTDPSAYTLSENTISWLPRTLDVRVLAIHPETGVNLSLEDTLRVVHGTRQDVMMWGPFIIRKELYDRSLWVRSILESGQAQYRAISTSRDMLVSDCIHAVAAVDPVFGRDHYPLVRIGIPASRYIARQVVVRSVHDQASHDSSWLVPRLGLDRYPITVVPPSRIPRKNCGLCLCPD